MTKERQKYMEQVSELLRQGKSRKEIGDIVKRDKAWMSRLIKEMRTEMPELLEGTAEAPKEQEKAPEAPEKELFTEPSNKPIQATKEKKHTETQMLSFRANTGDILRWKAYAQAKGMTATELYSAAINDYLTDNPLLNETEAKLYDLLILRYQQDN